MFGYGFLYMVAGLCLVAGVLAPAAEAAESKLIANLKAGKSQKVVVYGTSLTAAGAWVTQTKAWLDASYPGQVTLVNSGMGGRASQTGVNDLSALVLSQNPDTVFIEFATNDAFTGYATDDVDYNITLAKSKQNLNAMIDAIMAGHPNREVILQTMNPAWDAPNGNGSGSKRPDLAAYFQGYRDVAAERHLLLIDNYVNWAALQNSNPATFQSYVPDGIHPTATGYQAIVTPVIESALVPEPTCMALPLLGLGALVSRRLGRRQQAEPEATTGGDSTRVGS